jgi:cytochrome c biogenesis protein CcmG, thiol:disulfide interchange protein DsbE
MQTEANNSHTVNDLELKINRRNFIGAAVSMAPWAAWALELGEQAPAFELPGDSGVVRLSDYKGKTLYLDFWASWCVPCRHSFPWMNEMLARYQGNGLHILGINVDRRQSDARTFLQRTPARFELAFDEEGRVPKTYGVKAMPSSVLIGADGKVAATHRGFSDEERPELERTIRRALTLKPA